MKNFKSRNRLSNLSGRIGPSRLLTPWHFKWKWNSKTLKSVNLTIGYIYYFLVCVKWKFKNKLTLGNVEPAEDPKFEDGLSKKDFLSWSNSFLNSLNNSSPDFPRIRSLNLGLSRNVYEKDIITITAHDDSNQYFLLEHSRRY